VSGNGKRTRPESSVRKAVRLAPRLLVFSALSPRCSSWCEVVLSRGPLGDRPSEQTGVGTRLAARNRDADTSAGQETQTNTYMQ
jgi:hypothetical protein